MRKKYYKWLYGLLAALVTLAVLFGGQMIFNKYALARPIDKMFEQIDGIETFNISFDEQSKNRPQTKLHVKLNNVNNLQTLYTQIISGLEKYGGAKKYDIIISDYRSPRLEEFYYQIHYYLEESISTGKFVEMAEKVKEKAENYRIEAKIYVDAGFIYLQLKEEPIAQMYIVMPRAYPMNSQEAK